MQTAMITLITLVAFAANSVLCRWALMDQTIDPLSFSIVRILSGAATLLILLTLSSQSKSTSEPKLVESKQVHPLSQSLGLNFN